MELLLMLLDDILASIPVATTVLRYHLQQDLDQILNTHLFDVVFLQHSVFSLFLLRATVGTIRFPKQHCGLSRVDGFVLGLWLARMAP